jgi:hypothetical protein
MMDQALAQSMQEDLAAEARARFRQGMPEEVTGQSSGI